MNWLVFVCLLGWIYILTVLYRAKLNFWYYICGSVGLFIFSLILIEPYVVVPLQKAVSAVAGVIGGLTHLYDSYFQQGILFIQNGGTSTKLEYTEGSYAPVSSFMDLSLSIQSSLPSEQRKYTFSPSDIPSIIYESSDEVTKADVFSAVFSSYISKHLGLAA